MVLQVSFRLDPKENEELYASLENVRKILIPKLNSLTSKERQEIPKMGDVTFSFFAKAIEYGKAQNHFVPRYIDINELKIDFDEIKNLRQLKNIFAELYHLVDNTQMLSGNNVYMKCLSIYNQIKIGVKDKAYGAKDAYNDLKTRFPGRPPKKEENFLVFCRKFKEFSFGVLIFSQACRIFIPQLP